MLFACKMVRVWRWKGVGGGSVWSDTDLRAANTLSQTNHCLENLVSLLVDCKITVMVFRWINIVDRCLHTKPPLVSHMLTS